MSSSSIPPRDYNKYEEEILGEGAVLYQKARGRYEVERFYAAFEPPPQKTEPDSLHKLSFRSYEDWKRCEQFRRHFDIRRPARRRSTSPNDRIPTQRFIYKGIAYQEHEEPDDEIEIERYLARRDFNKLY